MIEIYFNPPDDIMYSNQEKGPTYETSPENLKAAESLIEKLQLRNQDTTILECYGMILSGKKNIDKAGKVLNDLYAANKHYVPVLLAIATAKLMKKQSGDAMKYLKEIDQQPYQPQFSDQYEKAWL